MLLDLEYRNDIRRFKPIQKLLKWCWNFQISEYSRPFGHNMLRFRQGYAETDPFLNSINKASASACGGFCPKALILGGLNSVV